MRSGEVYLYGDMTIKVMVFRCAEHCGFLRSCSSWCDGKAFSGRVHRYTARGSPRHQGGEGVAGTPGACSQVFCHPNKVHHTHAPGQTRRDVNYWYHRTHTQPHTTHHTTHTTQHTPQNTTHTTQHTPQNTTHTTHTHHRTHTHTHHTPPFWLKGRDGVDVFFDLTFVHVFCSFCCCICHTPRNRQLWIVRLRFRRKARLVTT